MKVAGPAFWMRAVAVWLLIAAVETLHGILRTWLLVSAIGEAAAQHIGFVIGGARVIGLAVWTSRWQAPAMPPCLQVMHQGGQDHCPSGSTRRPPGERSFSRGAQPKRPCRNQPSPAGCASGRRAR